VHRAVIALERTGVVVSREQLTRQILGRRLTPSDRSSTALIFSASSFKVVSS